MQKVDIKHAPEAYRQLARLFRAQKAHSADLVRRAAQALAHLNEHPDGHLAPWGRELLTAAFEALEAIGEARAAHMQEGLDALGPDADEDADRKEASNDAAYGRG